MDKVRLLFMPMVDANNTNAQSLNTREIALRLDPGRFQITLFYEGEPDARLRERPDIQLLRLPVRGKTRRILDELMSGYDVVAYIDYSPASYLFLRLPRVLRRGARTVFHAEAPAAQVVNPTRTLRFLYEGVFPRCDVYTGITEYVARDVYNSIGKKVSHILPVGVDIARFHPAARKVSRPPVILFAGTLLERKGPQHVVDAAARFPEALFRLVGAARGGYDAVLREKIATLGLHNVTVEGAKSQEEMAGIMRESDIFILPSRLEGIPKVTLEAAASGLPCIVFRDYETPSVKNGVTGFQVATIEEMMRALGRLIADRSLRESAGTASRQLAENFTWDRVSRQWESAYLEIAGRKAA